MKKMVMALIMVVMMAMNVTAANAAGNELGRFENEKILSGDYEVVELNKAATLGEWSDPDIFGNRYRLYIYNNGDVTEVICVKYHTTKEERKALKEAKKNTVVVR